MDLADLYFSVFAVIALCCASGVFLAKHPISGAVALVGVMLSLAGIYGVLAGPFLGVVQILVYAGAIMMLVIFVIMVLNGAKDETVPRFDPLGMAGSVISILFAVLVLSVLSRVDLGAGDAGAYGTIDLIASRLFDFEGEGGYYILFEIVGLALLVALTGAVLLAKRRLDEPEATALPGSGQNEEDH